MCCNKGAASNQSSLGQQRLAFLPGLLPDKSTTAAAVAALAKVWGEMGNSAPLLPSAEALIGLSLEPSTVT